MVRAQQLASVAQLVRALHRNRRADSYHLENPSINPDKFIVPRQQQACNKLVHKFVQGCQFLVLLQSFLQAAESVIVTITNSNSSIQKFT